MKNIFIGIDVSNKTLDICIKENLRQAQGKLGSG